MEPSVRSPRGRLRTVMVASGLLALAALLAWLYTAPYRALHSIRAAALEKDTERLADLVDFPSVREHLKEQFNTAMVQSLANSASSSKAEDPFSAAGQALGLMLARSMVDTFVDALASPSAISAMANGTRPGLRGEASSTPQPDTSTVAKARYDSLSRFTIRYVDARSDSTQIALHLRRYGLTWRLTSVDLSALTDPNNPALRSDRDAATRTAADLRVVGTSMMSWLADQQAAAPAGQIPIAISAYPPVSAEQVSALLVPKYIPVVPVLDGWGHNYEYHLERRDFSRKQVMLIRSTGRDGRFDATTYDPGPFDPSDFDQDIVWADGFFARWPQSP